MLNYKIIKVILNHYFCNINHLLSESEILNYYLTFKKYVEDDCDIFWDEIGSNYIIWQPFENVTPNDVLDNMEALYKDICSCLSLEEPNIIINPLELASDIAEQTTIDYGFKTLKKEYEQEQNNGDLLLTEDAQDVFNESYNLFLSIINDHRL